MSIAQSKLKWALPGALAVLSPIIPISVRYLTLQQIDALTINAFRLLAGGLALVLISYFYHRKQLREAFTDRRQLFTILLLAVFSLLAQYAVTEGIRRTSAVMSQLIYTLGLPLTILSAVMLFPDERAMARKPAFWLGTLLSLGGAIGIALCQGSIFSASGIGIVLLLFSVITWVVVGLLVKRLGATTPALVVAGISTLEIAVVFIATSFLWGNPGIVLSQSAFTNSVLVLSGVVGVLIGTGLAFTVAQSLGVIVYQFTTLVVPVLTGIFGYFLFRERLTLPQLGFGALLIIGCAIVVRFTEQGETESASP